jgi:serine/threonine protein phosphatase PrpC
MFASYESPLVVSGAVVSYGKFETPHAHFFSHLGDTLPLDELAMNRDYGAWEPDASLVVADGIGEEEGADMASHCVTGSIIVRATALRLREMTDESEAIEAVRDNILPFADHILRRDKLRHNLPKAKTLVSGVLFTQKHAIVHWTGDVRVYEYLPGNGGFRQVTEDQFIVDDETGQNLVSNFFEGVGRNRTGDPRYDDQVIARPLVHGARYLAVTDGFYGNLAHQAIPEEKLNNYALSSNDPEEIVHRLATLPLELIEQGTLIGVERGQMYYRPRHDDMTVGASLVG